MLHACSMYLPKLARVPTLLLPSGDAQDLSRTLPAASGGLQISPLVSRIVHCCHQHLEVQT